jgi:hypothetical protein
MPRSTRNEPYPAKPAGAKSGTQPPLLDARTVELIDRAVQIEQEDARAAGTISFVSRIFCHCHLCSSLCPLLKKSPRSKLS